LDSRHFLGGFGCSSANRLAKASAKFADVHVLALEAGVEKMVMA